MGPRSNKTKAAAVADTKPPAAANKRASRKRARPMSPTRLQQWHHNQKVLRVLQILIPALCPVEFPAVPKFNDVLQDLADKINKKPQNTNSMVLPGSPAIVAQLMFFPLQAGIVTKEAQAMLVSTPFYQEIILDQGHIKASAFFALMKSKPYLEMLECTMQSLCQFIKNHFESKLSLQHIRGGLYYDTSLDQSVHLLTTFDLMVIFEQRVQHLITIFHVLYAMIKRSLEYVDTFMTTYQAAIQPQATQRLPKFEIAWLFYLQANRDEQPFMDQFLVSFIAFFSNMAQTKIITAQAAMNITELYQDCLDQARLLFKEMSSHAANDALQLNTSLMKLHPDYFSTLFAVLRDDSKALEPFDTLKIQEMCRQFEAEQAMLYSWLLTARYSFFNDFNEIYIDEDDEDNLEVRIGKLKNYYDDYLFELHVKPSAADVAARLQLFVEKKDRINKLQNEIKLQLAMVAV